MRALIGLGGIVFMGKVSLRKRMLTYRRKQKAGGEGTSFAAIPRNKLNREKARSNATSPALRRKRRAKGGRKNPVLLKSVAEKHRSIQGGEEQLLIRGKTGNMERGR